jgi:hypothetical protein
MKSEVQPAGWNRERLWLLMAVAVWIPLIVCVIFAQIGIRLNALEANSHRIVSGMTQAEVEAMLGAPNPLPDLARKREAFWDADAVLGFRYVSIHVAYNADGRVARTRVKGWWRSSPSWKFW